MPTLYALDPRTAADRAAEGWLAFNVDSHDQDPASADGAPRNYALVGADNRDTSYFLTMYLRDSRAIDYIRSRPVTGTARPAIGDGLPT